MSHRRQESQLWDTENVRNMSPPRKMLRGTGYGAADGVWLYATHGDAFYGRAKGAQIKDAPIL